ncbi:TPA: hypothetical protein SOL37_002634 [Clostridioides difficile]|uniref:hypothetical protein n=1 Tax=Clostridioides difficile TaxID=1496 RepID=UPI00097FF1E5|nr:hypothetical protein [Clostridioides difficile]EGT3659670.1 hypothetical protein [Clostridioides difficile]EGT5488460.1 hypothetical protein [Clostridioides difficile]MBH7260344.1 hypothetical protein [Clostridioides difficile]MCL6820383.1 hypothetical protein [Clostridioides difficile]MDL5147426.1 hypothetical protein [Clostridioides difficile]
MEIRYCPYISDENKVTLLTLYEDDYFDDYYLKRYKYDEYNQIIFFDTYEEGVKWLAENIQPDKIDSEHIENSNNDYLWEEFMK